MLLLAAEGKFYAVLINLYPVARFPTYLPTYIVWVVPAVIIKFHRYNDEVLGGKMWNGGKERGGAIWYYGVVVDVMVQSVILSKDTMNR